MPNSRSTDAAAVEHLAKVMEMTQKISAKVDALLAPLAREMRIMKWSPEFQSIMWEAVMMEARSRLEAIDNGR